MRRMWIVLVAAVGLLAGVLLAPTLGANEPSRKEAAVAAREAAGPQPRAISIPSDLKYVPIDPVRAFDSRVAAYSASGILAPNSSRVISVKDGHDFFGTVKTPDAVPPGAKAVTYNLTVTGPTGPNFVSITPGDAAAVTTSAMNFDGTHDDANAGTVNVDATRSVKVWNGIESGSTHIIIDITGFYVEPLYAVVSAAGALTDGSRVVSVGTVPPGEYDVTFDRPVIDCAVTATIGEPGSEPAGLIDWSIFKDSATVTVFTQGNDGAPPPFEDRAFALVVTC